MFTAPRDWSQASQNLDGVSSLCAFEIHKPAEFGLIHFAACVALITSESKSCLKENLTYRLLVVLAVALNFSSQASAQSQLACLYSTEYGFLIQRTDEEANGIYDLSASFPFIPEVLGACSKVIASDAAPYDKQMIQILHRQEQSRQRRLESQGYVSVYDLLLNGEDIIGTDFRTLKKMADDGYSPAVQILGVVERFGSETPTFSDERRKQLSLMDQNIAGVAMLQSYGLFFNEDTDLFGMIRANQDAGNSGFKFANYPGYTMLGAFLDRMEEVSNELDDEAKENLQSLKALRVGFVASLYQAGSSLGAIKLSELFDEGVISSDGMSRCSLADELFADRIVESQWIVFDCLNDLPEDQFGPKLLEINALKEGELFHYLLGHAYNGGVVGLPYSRNKAVFHWERSAEMGDLGHDELASLRRGDSVRSAGRDVLMVVGEVALKAALSAIFKNGR